MSHDGTAIAWDLGGDRGIGRRFTFTHDRVLPGGYDGHPGSFSPDGRLVALGLKRAGHQALGCDGPDPGRPAPLETGGEVWALAFAPDGRTLAAVTVDGQATLWDVESRSLLRGPFTVGPGAVLGVSISADGTILATAGPAGVKLWDVATGEALDTIGDTGVPWETSPSARSGRRSGSSTSREEPRRSGTSPSASRIAKLPVTAATFADDAIAFSPDGRTLATGGLDDPIVHVWDVRTGKLIRELDQGSAGAMTLDFSPDGRTLAVSGFAPVASLWDVATGARIGPTLTAGSRRADDRPVPGRAPSC